ncbi:PREDICTED: uncharacterized protein LOC105570682, partial [Vollenhovia emeryi]|uniref:uncharacterized protein LOC105570682 n=1 Tax=Vollenhovia emeryi TaxID=411798 RepID=UPI0005F3A0D1
MPTVSADVAKLAYKKRAAKASLTRLETYVEGIDPAEVEIEELRLRIERLDEAFKTFSDTQIEIAANDDTISEADQDKESEEIENKYFRLKGAMERIVKDRTVRADEGMLDRTVIQANGAVNNDVGRACVPAFNAQIKLPRIELPRFSGAYEEWHSFYDMFGSLIHSNRDLNDTQKLHYLKSSLKGEAAEVVSSLEMTGDNYKDVWDRLSERYDNKRLTVQNHIRAIFDLPVVKREDSVVIRQILDGVLKHTRALRSLDRPIEHWGDLLVHIVTSKLDMKSIKEWENSIESTRVPTFEELIEFLKKRCQTLEAVSKVGRSNRANANSLQDNVQRSKGCNVATTKFKCSYCQGGHSVYSCKDFKGLSVDERVKYIKSKGWCLNCLKGKHMARDCSLDGCKTCSKRHNSLLHPKSPKDESSSESSLGKAKVVADKCYGTKQRHQRRLRSIEINHYAGYAE